MKTIGMLRFIIILIASICTYRGYERIDTINPNDTFVNRQIIKVNLLNIYWDSTKCIIDNEEDYYIDHIGGIHAFQDLAVISEKLRSNFLNEHKTRFYKQLPLLQYLDLPPPLS